MYLSRYCKYYSTTPDKEVIKSPLAMALNFACYAADMEDQNRRMEEERNNSGAEAVSIGRFLQQHAEEL